MRVGHRKGADELTAQHGALWLNGTPAGPTPRQDPKCPPTGAVEAGAPHLKGKVMLAPQSSGPNRTRPPCKGKEKNLENSGSLGPFIHTSNSWQAPIPQELMTEERNHPAASPHLSSPAS